MKRNYRGWKRNLPDFRDFTYSLSKSNNVPTVVDLRSVCPPILDQGNLGSCTANAGVETYNFLELKDKVPYVELSRLFLYYVTRSLEGTTRYDSGCYIRDVVKALTKFGICQESFCPYDIKQYTKKPSQVAYDDGATRKCTSYLRVNGMNGIRDCLASGYPIIFGFTVYSSFETDTVAETGVVPLPKRRESVLGGHCVLLVGYDDLNGWFICQNSWGVEWGDKGFFYLPYTYLPLMSDFWTVRSAKNI